jgi:hypothetical protein
LITREETPFELYTSPKISVAQLKYLLKDYGAKLTGSKPDLVERLRGRLNCKDIHNKD